MPYNAFIHAPNLIHADNGRVVGETLKNPSAVLNNITHIQNFKQADFSKRPFVPYDAIEHPYRKFNTNIQHLFQPQNKM
jgi:hypothetical protein